MQVAMDVLRLPLISDHDRTYPRALIHLAILTPPAKSFSHNLAFASLHFVSNLESKRGLSHNVRFQTDTVHYLNMNLDFDLAIAATTTRRPRGD